MARFVTALALIFASQSHMVIFARQLPQTLKSDDPRNSTERMLVLAPRGPIIVELQITLDGEPYRMRREQLVDNFLKSADANDDGRSTWQEAIANPRLVTGLINDGMNRPSSLLI